VLGPTPTFRERYGPWALVAGASEGLGAEFALHLAERGLDLVLVARRGDVLADLAVRIRRERGVQVRPVTADLAGTDAVSVLEQATPDAEIGLLVYNAASSVIAPFLEGSVERHLTELDVNCRTPLRLVHFFGRGMRARGRGGIILMSSLAGSQGSPFVAHYGATKAWGRVLAEGLWGELAGDGVDVMACCAGATKTPRYLAHRGAASAFAPEMEPAAVVVEALAALGKRPSMVPGRANRVAAFVMQRLLPRRLAITMMGNATRGLRE
jgi:short-subunit dehydrogenase